MAGCEHTDACEKTSRFPRFRPAPTVVGLFGDPRARVIRLQRRGKNGVQRRGLIHRAWYDRKIRRVRDLPCGDMRIYLEWEIRRVDCWHCGTVKQEKLDWLADTPFDTKRFSFFVGRRCQTMPVKDVAQETHRAGWTIRDLETAYLREQLSHVC